MKTTLRVTDYRGIIIEIAVPEYVKAEDISVSNNFKIVKSEIVCETNIIEIKQK